MGDQWHYPEHGYTTEDQAHVRISPEHGSFALQYRDGSACVVTYPTREDIREMIALLRRLDDSIIEEEE